MLKKSEVEKLNKYRKNCRIPCLANLCERLLDTHETMDLYPICVPSYNVNPKRRLIYNLVEEGLPFTVYAYSDQVDRYKEIGCTDIFEIDPSVRTSYLNPLAYKRNFILDHAKKRGANKIFMLDDDVDRGFLPCLDTGELTYEVSLNTIFHMAQFVANEQNIDMFALCACSLSSKRRLNELLTGTLSLFNRHCIQALIMSVTKQRYDPEMMWEDVDMHIQYVNSGMRCRVATFCTITFAGEPVMDYHGNKRLILDGDLKLVEKYGVDVVLVHFGTRRSTVIVSRKWQKSSQHVFKPCKIPDGVRKKLYELQDTGYTGYIKFVDNNGIVEVLNV